MNRLYANRHGLVIALLLALFSMLGISSAWKVLTQQNSEIGLIPKNKLLVNSGYKIKQNKNCIATFEFNNQQSDEQLLLLLKGRAAIKIFEQNEIVLFSSFVQFNNFGQFTGAILHMKIGTAELKFEANGVTNIMFKIISNTPQLHELFNYEFKGPIILVEHDQDNYRITSANGIIENYSKLHTQLEVWLKQNSEFKLMQGSCDQTALTGIDLTALLQFATKLTNFDINEKFTDYVKNLAAK